jgi:GDSL-like Lipase/Acylhydrolase family
MNSNRCLRLGRRLTLCVTVLLLSGVAASSQTSRDPALEKELGEEVARFVDADIAHMPAACEVLFVGSSSIVKWKDTLAADMAPMPVINRGFGGSHIEYVNEWFDQLVAPYRSRAIVFYAGENDLDAHKPVDRVIADFDDFMKKKTQALGNTPVYFISVKPSKLRIAELPLQAQVNQEIRARAEKRADLHFIDVVPAMLDANRKPKDIFGPDGLHMNRAGYEIWTQAVRAALLPHSEEDTSSCRVRLLGTAK